MLTLNSLCHNVVHKDSTSCYSMKLSEWNIERKILGCHALLSRALFLSSAYTVQTNLGTTCSILGWAMDWQPSIPAIPYTSQCLTLTTNWLLNKAQESTIHWILMPICSRDICWKIVKTGIETLASSPTCRMDTRKRPDAKATHLQHLKTVSMTYVP